MTETTAVPTITANPSAQSANADDALVIERRIHLRAAPDRVWAALTAESELSAWFGSGAQLDPRKGAEGWFEWEGEGRFAMRVEAVDAPRRVAWRWARDAGTSLDAGPSTLVEWTLESGEDGGTDLHLLESEFSGPAAFGENTSGWDEMLPVLQKHLGEAV